MGIPFTPDICGQKSIMWSLQKLMIFIELIHCDISCSFDIGIVKHILVELKVVLQVECKV